MTKEEAKGIAKSRLEEYLDAITTKKGRRYVCPICRSGTGRNKTPAGSVTDDKLNYHCFSCNFHGDIFELCAEVEGIANDAEKFNRVYEMFHINIDFNGFNGLNGTGGETKKTKSESKPKTKSEPESETGTGTDYTDYFAECHKRAGMTDYFAFRGLSKATVDRFMLGFDPDWRSPKAVREGKNPPSSPRVIIPTGKSSYVARAADPNADPKFKAVKEGKSELFNKKALKQSEPVFIVEGEFDALSVIEAGGQAVALGSTGNKNKFIELVGSEPPECLLIVSLDSDEAGRKAQSEIAESLRMLRIAFLEQNACGPYKDPSEYHTSDPDAFKRTIREDYALLYAEQVEAEKNAYINGTSVTSKIEDFLGDIKASVDTPAVPTNFAALDRVLDDGLYEGLYILGAISSLGKTSFALQVADQIAQQGKDVLIFSLEMARTELMAKSISRITFAECGDDIGMAKTTRGITSGKRHVNYGREEKAHINDCIQKYASFTDYLFVCEGEGDIGAGQVREITERHVRVTGEKPVVIIDYLQILAPYEPRATDKQNTDRAVFELKRLSRDFKIPVIGVSSLNRASYNSNISMAAFKESGAIEYSSDVLMGLQFEAVGEALGDGDSKITSESINRMKRKYPRKIELKILKNRNGATGDSIMFDYYPMFNYFHETGKKETGEEKAEIEIVKGMRR